MQGLPGILPTTRKAPARQVEQVSPRNGTRSLR